MKNCTHIFYSAQLRPILQDPFHNSTHILTTYILTQQQHGTFCHIHSLEFIAGYKMAMQCLQLLRYFLISEILHFFKYVLYSFLLLIFECLKFLTLLLIFVLVKQLCLVEFCIQAYSITCKYFPILPVVFMFANTNCNSLVSFLVYSSFFLFERIAKRLWNTTFPLSVLLNPCRSYRRTSA